MTTLEKLKCKLGFHAYNFNSQTIIIPLDKTHVWVEITCLRCGHIKAFIEPKELWQ